MRTLMTFLTIGAACAGYAYLQQAPTPGEPYYGSTTSPNLYKWNHGASVNASPVSAKNLSTQVREHTRSVLDDFVRRRGGQVDLVSDDSRNGDAITRLRQATQSAMDSSDQPNNGWNRDLAESGLPGRVPLPDFEEMQRIAFQPVAAVPAKDPPVTREVKDEVRRETANSVPSVQTPLVAAKPELPSKPALSAESNEASRTDSSISRTSRTPSNQVDAVAANDAPKSCKLDGSDCGKDDATAKSTPDPDRPVTEKNQIRRASKQKIRQEPVNAEWKVVGKTTEGLPMHTMHLGDGGTRTLIIAGLNGTDRTAVRWLEMLADELAARPDLLKTNEVVFFRAGNPDGLTHNRANNSRGVPLNRNFPSRRYRPVSDVPAFAVPAGELETRVILETLYTFRPRRVIHLKATQGPSQLIYNRAAEQLVKDLEASSKITATLLDSDQLPGSIEDFSDGTLDAAVLSLRFNSGDDWKRAWAPLQPHVLAAVTGQTLDAHGNEVEVFDPDRSPVPPATIEAVSRRPRRSGYEELPPPPQ